MPQIFVDGVYLGGCTEVIEAYENGELLERFRKAGIAFDEASVDAWSLLPQWLHSRKSA